MRYPEDLKAGGSIGFIAPSFGAVMSPYAERYENAKKKFTELGFSLVEGPNCHMDVGIGKSNTPEKCGEEINDFFLNDRSDVIISTGGGETMCEDLTYVDFDGIGAAGPKWYMGFSDNTNLTFLFPTLCDTAAFYAPCAGDFGMEPWHRSIEDAFNLLQGKIKRVSNYNGYEVEDWPEGTSLLAPFHIAAPYKQTVINGKKADFEGRLLGGCLDCLVNLCGTRFDRVKEFNEKYKEDGIIWFMESCDLNTMSVKRALWQLREAGWFDTARGFLIGRPAKINDEGFGTNINEVYEDFIADMKLPGVTGLDIGHLAPMMPMVEGALAHIKAEDNSIEVEFRYE